jgi:3',5'-cyclic AMP phosphodiesterase CpdA
VSTILHLTDLHLGDRDAHRTSIDDKTKNTASVREGTRLTVLKETLAELAAGMDSPPDCVVISGDITSADATSGYKRLDEVLNALGSKRPSPDRIVVVPGNHDVDWSANPGRAAKYTRFKKYVVNEGYVTPLLEGLHLNVDGTVRATTPVPNAAASPILQLDDIVVVAVNSSNFCGTRPGLNDKQKEFLDSYLDASSNRAVAEADLEKLGVFDMARISTGQLQMLTNELAKVKGDERIRICVLHHQLTPVSDREEIKPFETITNLGQFREWLVQHRFSVVLHGHKHESALLWDYLPPADDPLGPPVRVLVSAGPSPQYFNDPVGRILELGAVDGRAFVPGAPHARIKTFNACRTGGTPTMKTDEVSLDRESPQPAADNAFTVIRSATAQDAYEQLRHRVRRAQGHLHNVMCVVDEPASAKSLPDGYDAEENWLEDTVRWWQLPSSRLVAEGRAPFNHGERLYGGGNPLKAAAKQLGSTRRWSAWSAPTNRRAARSSRRSLRSSSSNGRRPTASWSTASASSASKS